MEISEQKKQEFIRKLLAARTRILGSHSFFGLLLMYVNFRIDADMETAATDGRNIIFGAEFLEGLNGKELDFVLMHEIMHIVLKHCKRGDKYNQRAFNIACDIVVNSIILEENGYDLNSISLRNFGVSMHLTPKNDEGNLYSAEEVYDMLPQILKEKVGGEGNSSSEDGKGKGKGQGEGKGNLKGNGKGNYDGRENDGVFDDHTLWSEDEDGFDEDIWIKRVEDAAKAIEIRKATIGRGTTPMLAKRMLKDLKDPLLDWRKILNDFVQEVFVSDYTFTPPDRRYDGSGFFLPGYNETEPLQEVLHKDILFMIDTSGSMSDDMITRCYSEIKGAIDQFDGRLKGYLGFFDAGIVEPKAFEDEQDFRIIRPFGGGGTDFGAIFTYVHKYMVNSYKGDKAPACIIILTDGYAPFPKEEKAMGIPVLWVINNGKVNPPWGQVARIIEDGDKNGHK